MKRLWTVLAAGCLATGVGCSNLRQGMMFRPVSDQSTAPPMDPAPPIETEPVDPFHPPDLSPAARLSRYFPGLSRAHHAHAKTADSLRRPAHPGPRDPSLEAVPRPELSDGVETTATVLPRQAATAAIPRRAGRPTGESRSLPHRMAELATDLPLLSAGVIAEADPLDRAPDGTIASPGDRVRRLARRADSLPDRQPPVHERLELSDPPAQTAEVATSNDDQEARRAATEPNDAASAAAPGEQTTPAATPAETALNLDPPTADTGPAAEPIEPARTEETARIEEPSDLVAPPAIAAAPPPINPTATTPPAPRDAQPTATPRRAEIPTSAESRPSPAGLASPAQPTVATPCQPIYHRFASRQRTISHTTPDDQNPQLYPNATVRRSQPAGHGRPAYSVALEANPQHSRQHPPKPTPRLSDCNSKLMTTRRAITFYITAHGISPERVP